MSTPNPDSGPTVPLITLTLTLTLILTLTRTLTQARLWVPETSKGERAPSGEPLFVVYGKTSRHVDRRVVVGTISC